MTTNGSWIVRLGNNPRVSIEYACNQSQPEVIMRYETRAAYVKTYYNSTFAA